MKGATGVGGATSTINGFRWVTPPMRGATGIGGPTPAPNGFAGVGKPAPWTDQSYQDFLTEEEERRQLPGFSNSKFESDQAASDEGYLGLLAGSKQNGDFNVMPGSDSLKRLVSRGMPQGIPGWAGRMAGDIENRQAPAFGDPSGLLRALTSYQQGDPTRGAMADYRYAMASRAGRPMTSADVAGLAARSGAAGNQAVTARQAGLLGALGALGTQDTRTEASNADWSAQRASMGQRMSDMAMRAKRDRYARYLDDLRNELFKGQIDMKRNLADQQRERNAVKNLVGGSASTAGALLSQVPGSSGGGDEGGFGDYQDEVDAASDFFGL